MSRETCPLSRGGRGTQSHGELRLLSGDVVGVAKIHVSYVLSWESLGSAIYSIILLKSAHVCLSLFANYGSQFLLDRLGRYLKLFVSTAIPSSHAFTSQFSLANFVYVNKNQKTSAAMRVLSWSPTTRQTHHTHRCDFPLNG